MFLHQDLLLQWNTNGIYDVCLGKGSRFYLQESHSQQKCNLLIFVSVRIIKPRFLVLKLNCANAMTGAILGSLSLFNQIWEQ